MRPPMLDCMGDEDFLDQLARTGNNEGRILAQAPEDLSGAQAPSCVYFFHRGLPLLKTEQHFFYWVINYSTRSDGLGQSYPTHFYCGIITPHLGRNSSALCFCRVLVGKFSWGSRGVLGFL